MRPRTLRAALRIAIVACAGTVHAEPLSVVQTLRSDEFGTRLADVVQLEVTEDRVYALSVAGSEALTVFDRDPSTGTLSERHFIGETDASGRAPASVSDSLESFARADDLLYLIGRHRLPACDGSGSVCTETGIGAYLAPREGGPELLGVKDDARSGLLVTSPDGGHAYRYGRGGVGTIEVFALGPAGDLEPVERLSALALGIGASIREIQFLDDERLLVSEAWENSSSGSFVAGALMVARRNPATGRLSRPVSRYVLPDDAGRLDDVAVSRDGTRAYASLDDFDEEARLFLSRLAVFRIDPDDDSIALEGIDDSANERVDESASFTGPLALLNDRIVVRPGTGVDRSTDVVHLWTAETPSVALRSFLPIGDAIGDGVNPVRTVGASPDGAYLYLGRTRDGGSLTAFAVHADLGAVVEPAGGRDGAFSSARGVVSNAGPADAYSVRADITADAPIERVEADARCSVDAGSATCVFDEIVARSGADIVVVTRSDGADADVRIGLAVEALQSDLDDSNDAAETDVRIGSGALAPFDGAADDETSGAAGGGGSGGALHPALLLCLTPLVRIRRSARGLDVPRRG